MWERERRLVRDIRTGGDERSYNHLQPRKVAEPRRVLEPRTSSGTRTREAGPRCRPDASPAISAAGSPAVLARRTDQRPADTSARGRLGLFAWALGDGVPCPSPRLASGTMSVPTCVLPEQLACPQRAFTHEKMCIPCQLCSPGPREGHRDFNLVLMNRSGILPLKYTAVSQPKMPQNYFKVFCS